VKLFYFKLFSIIDAQYIDLERLNSQFYEEDRKYFLSHIFCKKFIFFFTSNINRVIMTDKNTYLRINYKCLFICFLILIKNFWGKKKIEFNLKHKEQ